MQVVFYRDPGLHYEMAPVPCVAGLKLGRTDPLNPGTSLPQEVRLGSGRGDPGTGPKDFSRFTDNHAESKHNSQEFCPLRTGTIILKFLL